MTENQVKTLVDQYAVQFASQLRQLDGGITKDDVASDLWIVYVRAKGRYAPDGGQATFRTYLTRCFINWVATTHNQAKALREIEISVPYVECIDESLYDHQTYDLLAKEMLCGVECRVASGRTATCHVLSGTERSILTELLEPSERVRALVFELRQARGGVQGADLNGTAILIGAIARAHGLTSRKVKRILYSLRKKYLTLENIRRR